MSDPYFLCLTLVTGKTTWVNAAMIVGLRGNDGPGSGSLIFTTDGERPFEVAETMGKILEMLPSAWTAAT